LSTAAPQKAQAEDCNHRSNFSAFYKNSSTLTDRVEGRIDKWFVDKGIRKKIPSAPELNPDNEERSFGIAYNRYRSDSSDTWLRFSLGTNLTSKDKIYDATEQAYVNPDGEEPFNIGWVDITGTNEMRMITTGLELMVQDGDRCKRRKLTLIGGIGAGLIGFKGQAEGVFDAWVSVGNERDVVVTADYTGIAAEITASGGLRIDLDWGITMTILGGVRFGGGVVNGEMEQDANNVIYIESNKFDKEVYKFFPIEGFYVRIDLAKGL
jgi:hypothetical protein